MRFLLVVPPYRAPSPYARGDSGFRCLQLSLPGADLLRVLVVVLVGVFGEAWAIVHPFTFDIEFVGRDSVERGRGRLIAPGPLLASLR